MIFFAVYFTKISFCPVETAKRNELHIPDGSFILEKYQRKITK